MSIVVRYEVRSSVAIITLNRPDKRNAFSRELVHQIDEAITRAAVDTSVRSVILTGEGSAFCAGMDLEELRQSIQDTEEKIWSDAYKLAQLFDRIYSLSKPTIAAINGAAVAGGAGLVTVCDLAVSVSTAKFGYPEVRRGLVAAIVLPHLLRHVGERAARHLLLTGELIGAAEAARIGLINQVVEPEQLMTTALALAKSCELGGPHALASTKELLRRFSTQALSVEEATRASATPRLGEECRAGLAAFFDQRPVPWVAE